MKSADNLQNKVALSFVNDQAASTHGNVHVDSIFLSPSGEWRLGGFEVLSNPKDEGAALYVRPPGHATRHRFVLTYNRHLARCYQTQIPTPRQKSSQADGLS